MMIIIRKDDGWKRERYVAKGELLHRVVVK